jgi:hypothetical protein
VTTQPKVVAYNGALLKYSHVGIAIGVNEWDWASNVLMINVGGDPSGGTVEAGQRDHNITESKVDNITVDGITMTGSNIASVRLSTSSDSEIIKNCTIYNSFHGINADSDAGNNNTIQDTIIRNTVEYGIRWSGNSSTGTLIQRNNINDVGGKGGGRTNIQGMYLSIGTGTIVQNNRIYNCGDTEADHGIYLGGRSKGVSIRYNTIYNNIGWGVKVSNSNHVDVYYNLLYGNRTGGVIIEVGTPSYVNVYNNTIANSPTGANSQGLRASTGDHITWKNNIIYNINYAQFGDGTKYNYYVDGSVTNLVSDYNLVYSPTATAHYAFVDPKFVNSSTDFHIQPASPAINAGTNVGLTQDYSGNPISQGSAPDIGAYKFKQSLMLAPPQELQIY